MAEGVRWERRVGWPGGGSGRERNKHRGVGKALYTPAHRAWSGWDLCEQPCCSSEVFLCVPRCQPSPPVSHQEGRTELGEASPSEVAGDMERKE